MLKFQLISKFPGKPNIQRKERTAFSSMLNNLSKERNPCLRNPKTAKKINHR